MLDQVERRASSRALITDTLPYEVPVIFSNDKLYSSLVANPSALSIGAKKIIDRIQLLGQDVTKPYSYSIIKDGERYTTLGIIHPTTQIRIASFYESFSPALLASCDNGAFSLRRPIGYTSIFSEAELSGDTTFKLGIPHVEPADGEIDLSHVVSYFSYGKYNLLGKFVESDEFRRLEKRFQFLRMGDVTRCFSSIYTHSVSWAIKGKEFSKRTRTAFSFESKFDEIMQSANYGETNGIVIGPEVSRIFAEIILQDVDKKVESELKPLVNNKDYAVRRYVDDYFVFANSRDMVEKIFTVITKHLETYKLYPNSTKGSISVRPFVSAISLARTEISDVISCLYELVDEIVKSNDTLVVMGKARALRARANVMRQACSKYDVELHVVSGWLLTNLRNILAKLARHAAATGPDKANANYLCLSAVLDLIFYICAVDLRVRTTYALCQCLSVISEVNFAAGSDLRDRISHFIAEEMAVLVRNAIALQEKNPLGVELSNLLIGGYFYLGSAFLKNDAAAEALKIMASAPGFSYFRYITVKFCLWREAEYKPLLKELNDKAIAFVGTDIRGISDESEAYLTFVDLISCPDLTEKQKRKLIRDTLGGNPPSQIINEISRVLGFVDWSGMTIKHSLERKALRPVYTWS